MDIELSLEVLGNPWQWDVITSEVYLGSYDDWRYLSRHKILHLLNMKWRIKHKIYIQHMYILPVVCSKYCNLREIQYPQSLMSVETLGSGKF